MAKHFTRISATEHKHQHPDCGCQLVRDEHGSVSFYQCREHAAAPDLLQFAHNVYAALDENREAANIVGIIEAARAVINKAGGVA